MPPIDVKSGEYKVDKGLIDFRLNAIDERLGRIEHEQRKQSIALSALGVKSTVWGAAAGFLPAALVAAYFVLSK